MKKRLDIVYLPDRSFTRVLLPQPFFPKRAHLVFRSTLKLRPSNMGVAVPGYLNVTSLTCETSARGILTRTGYY